MTPQYLEQILSAEGHAVDASPTRRGALKDDPRMCAAYLLGAGLPPQQVYDVLSCWWWKGLMHGRGVHPPTDSLAEAP